jgi:hypothetical protein
MTLGIMTLIIVVFMGTLCIKRSALVSNVTVLCFYIVKLLVVMLNVFKLSFAMLSVMLNVVMLSVFMLNVVLLSVFV